MARANNKFEIGKQKRPTVGQSLAIPVDARRNNRTSSESLEYSYDFDDGGKPEAAATAPTAHHNYARPGSYTIRVDVKDTHWNTSSSVKQKVTVR